MNYDEAKSFMDNLSGRQIAETILQGISVPPLSVDALADIIERYANHRVNAAYEKSADVVRQSIREVWSRDAALSANDLVARILALRHIHDSTNTKGTTA